MSFNLQIDPIELNAVASRLAATDTQVQQALKSTLSRMAGWLRRSTVPGAARAANVPQKIIRRRLFRYHIRRSGAGFYVNIGYGLKAVPLIWLNARQTRTGVSAYGGRRVPHAFIARTRGGTLQVFRREGKTRTPVEVLSEEIREPVEHYLSEDVIDRAAFEERFLKTFRHELEWRLSKG